MTSYLEALSRDIRGQSGRLGDNRVKTVYIGGGTPSVLSGEEMAELLTWVYTHYDFTPDCEITVEANPESADYQKLLAYRQAGVNRISFGVQAFQNDILKRIGRAHTAEMAESAVENAKKAGFDNISLDLMFGLPGQTMDMWVDSLDRAIRLTPQHISCYSLTLEEGAPLNSQNIGDLPHETTERQMYYRAVNKLDKAGYPRYEISNFALPGYVSRHNSIYWTGADYMGFGLNAHSLVEGRRFHRTDQLEDYIAGDFSDKEEEILADRDKMAEFMFLGLRRADGVSAREFKDRFGKDLAAVYGGAVNDLINEGLLEKKHDRIFLTDRGIDISNRVFVNFIQD